MNLTKSNQTGVNKMQFIKNEIKRYGLTVACLGWLTLSAGAILCNYALVSFLKLLFTIEG